MPLTANEAKEHSMTTAKSNARTAAREEHPTPTAAAISSMERMNGSTHPSKKNSGSTGCSHTPLNASGGMNTWNGNRSQTFVGGKFRHKHPRYHLKRVFGFAPHGSAALQNPHGLTADPRALTTSTRTIPTSRTSFTTFFTHLSMKQNTLPSPIAR